MSIGGTLVRNGRERLRVAIDFPEDEGRTRQSEAASTDINLIMEKYERTGVLDHAREYDGRYGDFIDAVDYHTAMTQIAEAESMFAELPAKVRAEFDNDPGQLLAAVEQAERDEGERTRLEEIGVLLGSNNPRPGPAAPAEGTGGQPAPGSGPVSPPGDPAPEPPAAPA